MANQLSEATRAEYTNIVWDALNSCESRYVELSTGSNDLDFKQEVMFAGNALSGEDWLLEIAANNPGSLMASFLESAAVGISVNPVLRYAYFGARKGEIVYDPTYQGLIALATESGSIEWIKAMEVRAKDTFKYRGVAQEPEHSFSAFGDPQERGDVIGYYCIAKVEGDYLTETMDIQEIEMIRLMSDNPESNSWVYFYHEMGKKCVIKRAQKTWPKKGRRGAIEALARAVDISNRHDGISSFSIENKRQNNGETYEPVDSYFIEFDESTINKDLKDLVVKLVKRAQDTGQWAAAQEWAIERHSGVNRAYVLNEIDRAMKAA